jgi:F-type H+-transporting ATPase subunit b
MNINLTLFAQAVAFAAFIWFTYRFVWPPLMGAIETRQKQIADGLAAAEAGRNSLSKAEVKIGEMMKEAKNRSADIIAQGEKLKSETVEQAKAEAKAGADRILVAAKAEIQQEIARAKESLRDQLGDLVVAGASKILQREVDAKAHADLIASIKQQL